MRRPRFLGPDPNIEIEDVFLPAMRAETKFRQVWHVIQTAKAEQAEILKLHVTDPAAAQARTLQFTALLAEVHDELQAAHNKTNPPLKLRERID